MITDFLHFLGIIIICIGGIGSAALSIMSAFAPVDCGFLTKRNSWKFLGSLIISIILGAFLMTI